MELFGTVRQKVRDTALTALKASSDMIEVAKVNMAITSEESRIKALMYDIGKTVYQDYKNGEVIDINLASMCDDIISIEQNIEDMKQRILDIKNMRQCSGCGAEIDQEDNYCPKCGKKVETVKEEAAAEPAGDDEKASEENKEE